MIREKKDFDLTSYNTFRLPMTAARFIEYDTPADLSYLYDRGIFKKRWMHIGAGSNQLFATPYYDGTVLHRASSLAVHTDCLGNGIVSVTADAGYVLDRLIDLLAGRDIYGIENLSGIPGELGAGAVQNVGAYGVELGDRISLVSVFDTHEGIMKSFSRDECHYGYRVSRFKTGNDAGRYIVTAVTLHLTSKPSPVLTYGPLQELEHDASPAVIRDRVLQIRASKLPSVEDYGSAGSYFKNPVVSEDKFSKASEQSGLTIPYHVTDDGHYKVSAAWLIDHSGLKGSCAGDAALWPGQPLVIYNKGAASAGDIIELEQLIAAGVKSKFGIELNPEVQRIE